jgi:hypothetical protein
MIPPLTPVVALEGLDKFISVAKELAKLPALVLPQYRPAARDLYEISQKLLAANETLSRWLYLFLYFDFRHVEARSRFLDLVRDYRTMKQGPEFNQLKFSCGDISMIYSRNLTSTIGRWITNQAKLEEAEGIFATLADADRDMVRFTYDYVVEKLDDAVGRMETHVNVGPMGQMDAAEAARLEFKAEMAETTKRLEKFSGELTDLVIRFASIAQEPVTLRPLP